MWVREGAAYPGVVSSDVSACEAAQARLNRMVSPVLTSGEDGGRISAQQRSPRLALLSPPNPGRREGAGFSKGRAWG